MAPSNGVKKELVDKADSVNPQAVENGARENEDARRDGDSRGGGDNEGDASAQPGGGDAGDGKTNKHHSQQQQSSTDVSM